MAHDNYKETPQNWWNNLQQLLDEQGCDLNLNEPADLARLVIFDDKDGPEGRLSFAMDTSENGTIELAQPDDEFEYNGDDFLKAQGDGKIQAADINRLYMAAKEGKLYVAPLSSSTSGDNFRMLRADNDGNPSLLQDYDHLSPEDQQDLFNLTPPLVPKKPQAPKFGTYFRSFFGNKEAKESIASYQRELKAYETEKKEYDDALVASAQIAENKPWLKQFMDFNDFLLDGDKMVGKAMFQKKLDDIHRDSLVKDFPQEQKAYQLDKQFNRKMIVEVCKKLAELKGGSLKAGNKIEDKERRLLAEAFVRQSEIVRGEKMLKENKIEEFVPCKDINAEINKLAGSDNFKQMFSKMDAGKLLTLADKKITPDKALEELSKVGREASGNFIKQKSEMAERSKAAEKTASARAITEPQNKKKASAAVL